MDALPGPFDAASGHDADGYATSAAWLAGRCRFTPKAAKHAVRAMRQVSGHQPVADALAAGEISESLAGEIAGWTNRLPADMREGTDQILLQAAGAGADLKDLKMLADAAWEKWKSQRGKEDTRTIAQRFHDALQEGCALLMMS